RRGRREPLAPRGAKTPRLADRPAGRHDHAPGAGEGAFGELEAEQALALEFSRQLQLGRHRRLKAEALIVRRVTQQDDRGMSELARGLDRVTHQGATDAEL